MAVVLNALSAALQSRAVDVAGEGIIEAVVDVILQILRFLERLGRASITDLWKAFKKVIGLDQILLLLGVAKPKGGDDASEGDDGQVRQ